MRDSILWSAAALSLASMPALRADPTLPTIANNMFTVAAPSASATTNTTNLQNAINSANAAAGGGVVNVPAGTYVTNELFLKSGVNLNLAAGAVLQNNAPSSTFITTSGSNLHDIEISGSGVIDGHAIATSGNNMMPLQNISRLYITGVTIANASHEHLVVESDSDVTIDGININDNFSVAQTGDYLANTDAIDYSGNNFLIKNSNINAGDDDIVAKPSGSPGSKTTTTNVVITNDVIGAGHGISVGGQTPAGLNGLTVSNITFNGTDNGLRLKAGNNSGDVKGGGIVQNVSFSHIKMTNVTHPIIISSWYNGGDAYGSAEVSGSALHTVTNPNDPSVVVNESANTGVGYPFFDNISYSDITASGTSENVAIIYGLNSTDSNPADPLRNIDNISFSNVKLAGKFGADIYYVSNLDISGLMVFPTNSGSFDTNGNFVGTLNSNAKIQQTGNTFATTPEPGSLMVLGMGGFAMLVRRRAR
ncbi:MAG TPA: glycosyl hydrolase family 28 protein [Tepidisphaeraceae bacterium]|nr:glycosyl hydrolase family 28 protein [Tepidisphaeraceae bacterium]